MNPSRDWKDVAAVDASSNVLTVTLPKGFSTLLTEVANDAAEDGSFLNEIRERIMHWVAVTPGATVIVRFDNVLVAPSALFAWLTILARRVADAGGELHVAGLHPGLMEVVTLLQLDRLLDVRTTSGDARVA